MQLNSPQGSAGLGFQNTATLTINDSVQYAPKITSAKTATAKQGMAFSYQITALYHAASFTVSGLTDGFTLNKTTGVISGTPSDPGMLDLTLHAANAFGTASAPLTITIAPSAPVVTSAATASGQQGVAFSYQITAKYGPTGYGVSGLTDGLSVSKTTGVLSGTPPNAGTLHLTLHASNGTGTGNAPLTVTIAPSAPVITSATAASGTVGKAFSYMITATRNPTSYGASDLPAGLSIDEKTGAISGTPAVSGTASVSLYATGAGGTGMATLKLTIAVAEPAITSATAATAQVGKAFSYQIKATNNPTSYGVGGIRPGLSVNSQTGLISGTPTGSGTFTLVLKATNAGGTGQTNLTLTIKPSTPVITSPDTATATVGKAFSYQIRASSSPTSYGVGGLFAGFSVNRQSGVISGTPTASEAGAHTLTLQAANAGGTGTKTLTLTVTN